jgi:hypothetical protein
MTVFNGGIKNIDPSVFDAVLEAGDWNEKADDNGGNERLHSSIIREILEGYASRRDAPAECDIAGLGILVLTLSVAEWGVAWDGEAPEDPVPDGKWKGPPDITQGKHLMSYALGGIGLPHLDKERAVKFFDALRERIPEASTDLHAIIGEPHGFRYDSVRARGGVCAPDPASAVAMVDLKNEPFQHSAATFGGTHYCQGFNPSGEIDAERWRRLRHWCRVALRRRDMQEWILRDWLNATWIRSYNEVMRQPQGTVREALVIARMWNSSHGDALKAIKAAGTESNEDKRIARELANYAKKSDTHARRVKIMRRPLVAFDFVC